MDMLLDGLRFETQVLTLWGFIFLVIQVQTGGIPRPFVKRKTKSGHRKEAISPRGFALWAVWVGDQTLMILIQMTQITMILQATYMLMMVRTTPQKEA